MLVNIGGEPDRDDYGLPPIDIKIPDDARELERDIQAYHRELRSLRRRRLARRLGGPLSRDGMILPLLAGCLALTLLAGTLLTMFTAVRAVAPTRQLPGRTRISAAGPSAPAASTRGASAAGPSAAAPSPGVRLLPNATVKVAGSTVSLRNLHPAVLVLVSARCQCGSAARRLGQQAAAAHVTIYLVPAAHASAGSLAKSAHAQLLSDTTNALRTNYQPVGLTAVLVSGDGAVRTIRKNLTARFDLSGGLRMLRNGSA
ncbi:MAG TPA: hypothetical protein VG253_21580 [Streptosporangiaceae bacterium]|nr:hypothetical protein [Streptosporangiaceae bacterium]